MNKLYLISLILLLLYLNCLGLDSETISSEICTTSNDSSSYKFSLNCRIYEDLTEDWYYWITKHTNYGPFNMCDGFFFMPSTQSFLDTLKYAIIKSEKADSLNMEITKTIWSTIDEEITLLCRKHSNNILFASKSKIFMTIEINEFKSILKKLIRKSPIVRKEIIEKSRKIKEFYKDE